MPGDPVKTQLAIQSLKKTQEATNDVLTEVSTSLKSLVDMQHKHEIFHEKVNGKFDVTEIKHTAIDNRLKKVEGNQKWTARLIIGAVLLAVITATIAISKGS